MAFCEDICSATDMALKKHKINTAKKLHMKKLDLTAHKELAQAAASVNPGTTTNNNMDEDVDGLEAPLPRTHHPHLLGPLASLSKNSATTSILW